MIGCFGSGNNPVNNTLDDFSSCFYYFFSVSSARSLTLTFDFVYLSFCVVLHYDQFQFFFFLLLSTIRRLVFCYLLLVYFLSYLVVARRSLDGWCIGVCVQLLIWRFKYHQYILYCCCCFTYLLSILLSLWTNLYAYRFKYIMCMHVL